MTIRPRLVCMAAGLLLVLAPALAQAQTSPQGRGPRPFSWWKSEPFKKELGLTTEQATRIDHIWEATRSELRQEWTALSTLESKLSHLIQVDADEAALTRQIDRVETARASANKTRSLMLVQMLKVLTPDQRTRFNALHERWRQDTMGPRLPSDPQRRH